MSEENAVADGQNGAILNDPVDVIIDKLLRYDRLTVLVSCAAAMVSGSNMIRKDPR